MLVDIFSCFDDSNQVFMSMYMLMWMFNLMSVLVFSSVYWVCDHRNGVFMSVLNEVSTSQIFRSFGLHLGGFTNVVGSLFIVILALNLSGLVPYVFSTSSHLAFCFTLGFPLWLSLVISSFSLNSKMAFASLLPSGAPSVLNPFLILIETVSILVRSITISVRLTANMSSGHIVMVLLSNYVMMSLFIPSLFSFSLLVVMETFYMVFELGIGFIQAYIFCLLISLYSDEHSHI